MDNTLSAAELALRDAAREYHRSPVRGKISVNPTKPLSNQRDLSLAYSPGVAYPCLDIQADPSLAFDFTARGNLVGVVTNGTAVLGLGNIGPLAAKPVMEGKGCLFKKFAGVDVFDIELAENDPDKLIDMIAALEPTLGGINLEDIKAPECFYIERELSKRMNIPVFHDDQHGTAIISSAALINALELVGKDIGSVKIAVSGAGAAALACVNVMVGLGVNIHNVFMCDSKGVVYEGRPGGYDESKARFAQKTQARTMADAVDCADVFLGCSAPGWNSSLDRPLDNAVCEMSMIRSGISVLLGSWRSICCSTCSICASCCFSGSRFAALACSFSKSWRRRTSSPSSDSSVSAFPLMKRK